jgi:periplasmic protein TonB
MTGKVNIFTDEWCDVVFEGKNKEYGAYENRKLSAKRHATALLVSVLLVVLSISAPVLIKVLIPKKKEKNVDVVKMIDIKMEQPKEQKFDEPPPPPLKTTIKFTPPEITTEEVPDEVKTQDEVIQNKASVSIADIQGTDDVNGIDVSELRKTVTEEKKEQVYQVVEQMPEFPGGQEALAAFLGKNIKYPDAAKESGISGRVYIQFVVNKSGQISNVKLVRGIGGGCDEEAIRVVKKMPPWRAGKQNGQSVSVFFNLPIVFTLAE